MASKRKKIKALIHRPKLHYIQTKYWSDILLKWNFLYITTGINNIITTEAQNITVVKTII